LHARALADARIRPGDLRRLHVVARPEEVCAIVDAAYAHRREQVRRQQRRGSCVDRHTGP
jgi:hypothetical protein